MLDNVRVDSMSLHGYGRPTTPNLERLAPRAIRFDQARATAPWTLPSHASMFTGRWPHELSVGWDRPLDAMHPTLAEALAGHGYATAGFVGNTYYCNTRYGLGRGFARYEDDYENQTVSPFEVLRSTGLGKRLIQALGFPIRVEEGGTSIRKTAEMLNRDVLGWLDRRPPERPFFVFLNYFDAHCPFVPPEGPDPRFGLCALPEAERIEKLKRFQRLMVGKPAPGDGPRERVESEVTDIFRDSYESCIAYLDRQVGRLFAELGRRGLLDDTLVIVTSDHGEHFNEHGFFGHGLSLYRRELHVPLLIFPPSPDGPGRVIAEPVSLRELPATALNVLGLGARPPFPGPSLARFWMPDRAPVPAMHAPPLSEVDQQERYSPTSGIPVAMGPLGSIVEGGKVYIRDGDGREEVYDLLADPSESRNLAGEAASQPALGHLRRSLERLVADPARWGRAGQVTHRDQQPW